ncbi:hypothetical protein OPQ81_005028 [Rhizoctonia solani]|nr:hypothetical protein OPQ81_005028 [Rhizoctonia solani]
MILTSRPRPTAAPWRLSVTLGGYLDLDIASATLASLYVDVETTTSVDVVLELDVTAPYDGTFSYGDGVEYYLVNVPGILTFGPALTFAVGAEISVDAAVDLVLDLGADIDNGTVHLDLVGDGTTAAGWTPSYHANLTIGEEAAVGVTPFVSVTVELEFEILGGLLDLSGGGSRPRYCSLSPPPWTLRRISMPGREPT